MNEPGVWGKSILRKADLATRLDLLADHNDLPQYEQRGISGDLRQAAEELRALARELRGADIDCSEGTNHKIEISLKLEPFYRAGKFYDVIQEWANRLAAEEPPRG